MTARNGQDGHTMIEMLIALAVVSLILASSAPLLVQNASLNKTKQMTMAVQADARNSMTMIVNTLRSAGWDPKQIGFSGVNTDPDPSTGDNFIVVVADLNMDNDILDLNETVEIRHTANRIEWKTVADPNAPFTIIAENITNDEDDNGVPEPMFLPDSLTNPSRVTVKITARSPEPDPISREFIRYTLSSDVILRGNQ